MQPWKELTFHPSIFWKEQVSLYSSLPKTLQMLIEGIHGNVPFYTKSVRNLISPKSHSFSKYNAVLDKILWSVWIEREGGRKGEQSSVVLYSPPLPPQSKWDLNAKLLNFNQATNTKNNTSFTNQSLRHINHLTNHSAPLFNLVRYIKRHTIK